MLQWNLWFTYVIDVHLFLPFAINTQYQVSCFPFLSMCKIYYFFSFLLICSLDLIMTSYSDSLFTKIVASVRLPLLLLFSLAIGTFTKPSQHRTLRCRQNAYFLLKEMKTCDSFHGIVIVCLYNRCIFNKLFNKLCFIFKQQYLMNTFVHSYYKKQNIRYILNGNIQDYT